jgi:hypothetical protein
MARVFVPTQYLSQRDNQLYRSGTCNTTSIAMGMGNHGELLIRPDGTQLEDYLTQYCLDNRLSRHSPGDLEILAQKHGYRFQFSAHATWDDVKAWLRQGRVCIVHGWFTAFGHILVICGYDEEKQCWIVHDPWGEWYPGGYDTSVSGEALEYSFQMMSRLCGPDAENQLWIHFVNGKSEDKRVWKPGELGGLRLQDIYERKLSLSLADVKKDIGLTKQVQICLTRFPQFQPGTPDGSWGPVTQKAFENLAFSFQIDARAINFKTAKILIEGKYR